MTDKELVDLAIKTKNKAYAPYSGFKVGAALVTDSGAVYTGVNIENGSYGATVCAERTAIFKAVSEGESRIRTLAVASDSEGYTYPCGICRQVMMEFASPDIRILCGNNKGEYEVFTIDQLFPRAFKLSGSNTEKDNKG